MEDRFAVRVSSWDHRPVFVGDTAEEALAAAREALKAEAQGMGAGPVEVVLYEGCRWEPVDEDEPEDFTHWLMGADLETTLTLQVEGWA